MGYLPGGGITYRFKVCEVAFARENRNGLLVEAACVLAVAFRPVSACALGFSVLGIPVCLNPVLSPRVWTSRGLSRIAPVNPIRASAAAVERPTIFCIPLPPAVPCVYPAVRAARTCRQAGRCLAAHACRFRCMGCIVYPLDMLVNIQRLSF